MTVTVTRLADEPTHGRPRLLEFTEKGVGRLSVHVERDSRALWLFVEGPKGGDRGKVIVAARDAGRLAEWLLGDVGRPFFATPAESGYLGFGDVKPGGVRTVTVRMPRHSRGWHMVMDPDAFSTLIEFLSEWAAAVAAAG